LERIVPKTAKKTKEEKTETPKAQPWISMRSGIKIIAFTSIVMAVLTAWQVIPSKGWLEGILWGLLFGVLIWAIFFGNILINRLLHK
jgi:uncharacterized membrane protein